MHTLIAETDLVFLAETRSAFEKAGHHVTICTDGMQAWDCLVDGSPPDLLVTRLDLGAGTPPGTALGLYARSCDPPVQVIYIPANAERAQLANSDHGAVLVKPFSPAELIQTAHRLLEVVPADNLRT